MTDRPCLVALRDCLRSLGDLGAQPPTTDLEAIVFENASAVVDEFVVSAETAQTMVGAVQAAASEAGFVLAPAGSARRVSWRDDLVTRILSHCVERYHAAMMIKLLAPPRDV